MDTKTTKLIKSHLQTQLKNDDISDEVGYEAHNAINSLSEIIEFFAGTPIEKILEDAQEVCRMTSAAFGNRDEE
jgi:hypothetical protein